MFLQYISLQLTKIAKMVTGDAGESILNVQVVVAGENKKDIGNVTTLFHLLLERNVLELIRT